MIADAERTVIPVTVPARNEARCIGACLDSLLAAARHAESRLPFRYEVLVVCDRTTDGTEAAALARDGVRVVHIGAPGGKVAAQRAGLRPGPFQIFCDADVTLTEDTLFALTRAMLDHPRIQVAFPPHAPLPPRSSSLLARAIHLYNLRRGYASQRTWFSGRLFAIRDWRIPTCDDLAPRLRALPADAFYDFASGLRVDDVYLSRTLVAAHGPGALLETKSGLLRFRAPETLSGMYRYYRRMRHEIERLDALFPETRDVHRRHGIRDQDLLAAAPLEERLFHRLFASALLLCRLGYVIERNLRRRLGRAWDPWPPVEETKWT